MFLFNFEKRNNVKNLRNMDTIVKKKKKKNALQREICIKTGS